MYGQLPLSLFPKRLRAISDTPTALWYRGKKEGVDFEKKQWCALVGSRYPSEYGKKTAYRFARDLAKQGVVVVSGLARGIDAQVHQGALDAHGCTVAVLGTSIDHIYPHENISLANSIVSLGGLIVSEVKPGGTTSAQLFSRRNRIITGLSHAVVVIEGAMRSGTLTTVRFALQQGREVGALPGDVDRPTSFVPNMLLQQGASPITSVEDILELMMS